MKKVLVTGGVGYVGSHVVACLGAQDIAATIIDDLSNATRESHKSLETLCDKAIPLHEVCVTDYQAVKAVFSEEKPDAVIHCAGLKSIGESWENALRYHEVNVGGTMNVLRAMDETGCRTMVFSSSATVYGEPTYTPIDEQHPIAPTNPYGRSKRMAEEVISDWSSCGENKTAILLRYYNPVGAHESLLVGENPSARPNNLFPIICEVATGKHECLDIMGDDYPTQDGTGERDYIHICDLSEAHYRALMRLDKGLHTLNIGTGSCASVKQIIALFEAELGTNLPTRIAPRRMGDVSTVVAQNTKSIEILGDYIAHDLTAAVASSLAFGKSIKP